MQSRRCKYFIPIGLEIRPIFGLDSVFFFLSRLIRGLRILVFFWRMRIFVLWIADSINILKDPFIKRILAPASLELLFGVRCLDCRNLKNKE